MECVAKATQECSQTRQCLVGIVKPIRPEGTLASCQREGKVSGVPLGRRTLRGHYQTLACLATVRSRSATAQKAA